MLKEMRKKDIAICIILIAISLISVVSCNNKFQESVEERKATIRTAVKVKDDDLFNYALNTRQGNIVATGEVKAIDPVKFEEMNQEFIYIKKVKEHYVMKTRTVTYTDSEGKIKTKTETYWEWDVVKTEKLKSQEVLLLNKKYPTSKFELPYPNDIDAKKVIDKGDFRYGYIYLKSDVRVSYEVIPKSYETTFLAKVGDSGLESTDKNKILLSNTTYSNFMESELKDSLIDKILFIIFLILVPSLLVGVYINVIVLGDFKVRRRY